MRVQLVSDLHLERYPDYQLPAVPTAELLVLAGDIGSYQARSRLLESDFGLTRFSPKHGAPWDTVLYVPGNHEFDASPYEQTYARLRGLCDKLGITWLERETVTIGSVRFAGCTLWSDFDALAQDEVQPVLRLKAREKAFRAANFYLRKNTTLIDGRPAMADAIRELSLTSRAWLSDVLHAPFAGQTVVVTHFAPSLRSADPRYGVSPGTAGFCNSLDDLLPHASVWMHGHLHCPNDYLVTGEVEGRPRTCRVVANPRGYDEKGEQTAFREDFVIDLGSSEP